VQDNRSFAFTLVGAFLFFGLLALWRQRPQVAGISFGLSIALLFAGLFVPGQLRALRRGWMKIGQGLSFVTTPVLMAALYYLVFTPPAMLRRLGRRRRPKKVSGWHRRPPLPPPSRMERQF
jgi:uncharacterized membrane protein YbhN (UPF0104 family)